MEKQYFLFRNREIVFRTETCPEPLSESEFNSLFAGKATCIIPLDRNNHTHFAAEIPEGMILPAPFNVSGMRKALGNMHEEMLPFWLRSAHLLQWEKSTRFCASCGNALETHPTETAKRCPACAALFYPTISPCIIVLIYRNTFEERQVLLAHSPKFPLPVYSILAGFMEAGESAEETIRREIYEEVGITVKNLRYFASQAWPFPHQLMLGFFAEYDNGEIQIDNDEISDARWFSPDALPKIPAKGSIARNLIDTFLRGEDFP